MQYLVRVAQLIMKKFKISILVGIVAKVHGICAVAVLLLSVLSACSSPVVDATQGADEQSNKPVYMAFDVRAASGTTTFDAVEAVDTDPEMRINSLRILIFDRVTGGIRYNLLRTGAQVTQHVLNPSAAWHGAFEILPGNYDFYFVANEAVAHSTMQAALLTIQNRSEFFTNPAFTQYPLTQAEFEGTAPAMVMTQCFENVTVNSTRNGKGLTMSDPQHFLDPIGQTERIALVRTLAKTTLIVQDVVEQNSGKYILKFKHLAGLQSLTLENLPHVSLFGTPYFTALSQAYTAGFYSPAIVANRSTLQDFTATGGRVEGEVEATRVQPGTLTGKYNYRIVRYVPELLRQASTAEALPKLNVPTAISYHFNNTLTNYYTVSIDHRKFNDLTGSTGVDPLDDANFTIKDYYTLPNPTNYSRYSVLRNTHYEITAREESGELLLTYVVEPWQFVVYKPVYVGNYFNVWIEDCTFGKATQTARIVTSMPNVPREYHRIELRPLSGNSFNAPATHNNMAYQSESKYTFTATAGLPVGTPMFEIRYNGKVVATITKGNTDCSMTTP